MGPNFSRETIPIAHLAENARAWLSHHWHLDLVAASQEVPPVFRGGGSRRGRAEVHSAPLAALRREVGIHPLGV